MSHGPRLGVLGWPVAHSRSPAMHNPALQAVGLHAWRYQRLPVPPERLKEVCAGLPAAGFRGANVTIPHKSAALRIATHLSDRARAIGAANTLCFEADGAIRADNTDAPGFLASLPFSARGRSALVLGAGGSARAVVWALLDAGAGEVAVWNRTPARAQALSAELGAKSIQHPMAADLLVNCTSIGLDASADIFNQLPLTADAIRSYGCVVDFVYSQTETRLVATARAFDIPVVDGLDLLVAQGALSFEQFTGRSAPVTVMRAAVRRDE